MNIQNICDSVDTLKRLVLIGNNGSACFSVKTGQTIMAELCCLSKLSMPMDGFERVSNPIVSHDSYTVFDNALDISPLTNKMQVRGMILCFGYPALDDNGAALDDKVKNALLHVYDKDNNTMTIPACKSFILLGNPITSDPALVLNRLVVENVGDFTLTVEGLLILVNKNGMVLTQGSSSCC